MPLSMNDIASPALIWEQGTNLDNEDIYKLQLPSWAMELTDHADGVYSWTMVSRDKEVQLYGSALSLEAAKVQAFVAVM